MTTPITKRMTVFATFSFEAAHRLPNVPDGHKCGRMHGHNWTVEIQAAGVPDAKTGFVVDYYDIERAWKRLYERLDHRVLNEVEGLENPTTEVIADWIGLRMHEAISLVSRVIVRETPAFGAIYEVRGA